jgi:uncharacterized membrane protein
MFNKIVTAMALVATTSVAMIFTVFSVIINPSFRKLSDKEYLLKMQKINRDIQNPGFFSVFFGVVLLLPLSIFLNRNNKRGTKLSYIKYATLFYVIGTFGVTLFANVPLNERLDRFSVHKASNLHMSKVRNQYARSWNAWNIVRTIASLAAVLTLLKSRNKNK